MLNRRLLIASIVAMPIGARARSRPLGDDFRGGLGQWQLEADGEARVMAQGGVLDIDAPRGLTFWYKQALKGPVAIGYDVRAVSTGGPHDEVSDVNAFWMASDPSAPGGSVLARPRNGIFEAYDTLRTYYIGIGGNRNTTTRMRRYVGRPGDRPLLSEHDRSAKADMLEPNRWFHLALIADGHRIAVERDGAMLFEMNDPNPYRSGHFGLRTTQSHIQVRNLTITKI
jgi:hypothetical protein